MHLKEQLDQRSRRDMTDTADSILIVEDDPDIRQFLHLALTSEGLPVSTVGDGYAAVSEAMDRQPSLVILDMNLPTLDGETVAGAVELAYGRSAPVILISGDPNVVERTRRTRAAAFLRKPFDLDD